MTILDIKKVLKSITMMLTTTLKLKKEQPIIIKKKLKISTSQRFLSFSNITKCRFSRHWCPGWEPVARGLWCPDRESVARSRDLETSRFYFDHISSRFLDL